jgi:hypothetical protein
MPKNAPSDGTGKMVGRRKRGLRPKATVERKNRLSGPNVIGGRRRGNSDLPRDIKASQGVVRQKEGEDAKL